MLLFHKSRISVINLGTKNLDDLSELGNPRESLRRAGHIPGSHSRGQCVTSLQAPRLSWQLKLF